MLYFTMLMHSHCCGRCTLQHRCESTGTDREAVRRPECCGVWGMGRTQRRQHPAEPAADLEPRDHVGRNASLPPMDRPWRGTSKRRNCSSSPSVCPRRPGTRGDGTAATGPRRGLDARSSRPRNRLFAHGNLTVTSSSSHVRSPRRLRHSDGDLLVVTRAFTKTSTAL